MAKSTVQIDKYKRFYEWLKEHADLYGVMENNKIKESVNNLVKTIEEQVGEFYSSSSDSKTKHKKAVAFYMIFKSKYLEWKDIEYMAELSAADIRIIESFIEKLDNVGITTEDYLTWMFDNFFPNNPKISPYHKSACSGAFLQNYIEKNQETISDKKQEKEVISREDGLIEKAKIVFRKTKNNEVLRMIKEYRDKLINIDQFEESLIKIENS